MTYLADNVKWTDRGRLFKPSVNADEAEIEAIRFGSTPIDSGTNDDVIADEHHADTDDIGTHWEEEDIALEQVVGPVITEIDRRAILGGNSYPFQRENNTLIYQPSITKVYESCLVTSLQKNISTAPYNALPLTFELICTEVSKLFLGEDAESFRTGWPPHGQRPQNFRELMLELSRRTGEFRWSPQFEVDSEDHFFETKDEGLDFVAWKRFPDSRVGGVFLLGQCACGQNWESKLNELEPARLKQWCHPVTWAKYIKSFAVPHHIPGNQIFSYICSRAGIILDRLRLSLVAERFPDHLSQDLNDRIKESIEIVIPDYKYFD